MPPLLFIQANFSFFSSSLIPTSKHMNTASHFVVIFGGAVSGAEAAWQLAQRGIHSVVFEQQALPYGKIEDGLPKWHVKLRDKEEGNINEKLSHELVDFVPNVKLGKDISFEQAVNWGFTAVILATGAWNDRPLPIDGIDEYVGKGLYYQNPFIYWFNHKHEPNYAGEQYEIQDGAIVIGGGLASMDVVKVLMIETVAKALEEKGHKTDIFTLDKGIGKVLEGLGLTLADLGVKGCTLYYRRRNADMPLSPTQATTPEEIAKAETIRAKILETFQKRFLFNFEGNMMPVDKVVEDGRLTGMVFRQTKVEDGKVSPVEGSDRDIKAPLVISSIGSIPELIEGIPAKGQVFRIKDMNLCQIEGHENVFAIGNAVTGRGNINESLKHGKELSGRIMDEYLNWSEEDFQNLLRVKEAGVEQEIEAITKTFEGKNLLPEDKIQELAELIKEQQAQSEYDGNFNAWVEKNLPKRLEDMIGVAH